MILTKLGTPKSQIQLQCSSSFFVCVLWGRQGIKQHLNNDKKEKVEKEGSLKTPKECLPDRRFMVIAYHSNILQSFLEFTRRMLVKSNAVGPWVG